MTRSRIFAVLVLAASLTMPGEAQTVPGAERGMAPQPLTLLGCVRAWDAAAMTVITSPATAAGVPPRFVITDVAAPPKPPTPGATEPPAKAAPTAAGAHGTYLLSSAQPSIDLAAYVGQQVEVRGTLATATGQTAGAPAPRSSPAGSTTAPRSAPVQFSVTDLKVVAATCP